MAGALTFGDSSGDQTSSVCGFIIDDLVVAVLVVFLDARFRCGLSIFAFDRNLLFLDSTADCIQSSSKKAFPFIFKRFIPCLLRCNVCGNRFYAVGVQIITYIFHSFLISECRCPNYTLIFLSNP